MAMAQARVLERKGELALRAMDLPQKVERGEVTLQIVPGP